jgi:hypothetical protein
MAATAIHRLTWENVQMPKHFFHRVQC